jgi:hypothetical protein
MAFSATSANHEAPWKSLPGFSVKQINTGTWGANSNTCVITDSNIHPNSVVLVNVSGTTPAVGNWSYTVAQGQVTITSTDAESSTLALTYIVI